MANVTFTKYCFRALRYFLIEFGAAVLKGRMSPSGQERPFGIPNSMSAAGGRPDVIGPKADVAAWMSAVGGIADVNFETAYDRV